MKDGHKMPYSRWDILHVHQTTVYHYMKLAITSKFQHSEIVRGHKGDKKTCLRRE